MILCLLQVGKRFLTQLYLQTELVAGSRPYYLKIDAPPFR